MVCYMEEGSEKCPSILCVNVIVAYDYNVYNGFLFCKFLYHKSYVIGSGWKHGLILTDNELIHVLPNLNKAGQTWV